MNYKTRTIALTLFILSAFVFAFGQNKSEIKTLVSGQTVQGTLRGGEKTDYQINLKAGNFLRIVVEQKGIDVLVKLSDARGKVLRSADYHNSNYGPTPLSYEAAESGVYRIQISAFKKNWNPNSYTINTEILAFVTDTDRKRANAELLMQEAQTLFKESKKELKQQALEKMQTANAVFRELGDNYWEAETAQTVGYFRKELGDDTALETFNQALSLWQKAGDLHGECRTLNDIGNFYFSKNDADKAAAQYLQTAELCQKAGDIYYEGFARSNLADVFFNKKGDYRQSADNYQKALPLFRQIGDKDFEGTLLNAIGVSFFRLKEYDKAHAFFQQSLAIEKDLQNFNVQARVLNNLGDVFYYQDDYEKAIKFYQSALDLSRQAKIADKIIISLSNLAAANKRLDHIDEALAYYSELTTIYRNSGDELKQAEILNTIGLMYFQDERYSKALDYHKQAAALVPITDETSFAADLQFNVADCYFRLDKYRAALESLNAVLKVREKLDEKDGQAETLNKIGEVLLQLSEYKSAEDHYNRALTIYKSLKDRSGEAESLLGIGYVFNSLSQWRKAIEIFKQALSIYQTEANDKVREMDALQSIGNVYESLDDRKTALKYYDQVLTLARDREDRGGEASVLSDIGDVYYFYDEYDKALENYNLALRINRDIEDRAGESITLINIGSVYSARAEYQSALDFYNQALQIRKQIEDKSGISSALSSIGGIYQRIGEQRKALEFYEKCLQINNELGDKGSVSSAQLNIADVYYRLSEYQKSLEYVNQALLLKREIEDKSGESRALNLMGLVYDNLGDKEKKESPKRAEYLQKSLDSFLQSLEIDRKLENSGNMATTLGNIAVNYYFRDEYDKALEYFNQSIALKQKIGNKRGEALDRYWIARMMQYRKMYAEARPEIEAAIKIQESFRGKMTNDELRMSYFASLNDYYGRYIDILMQLDKQQPGKGLNILAFEASERYRARSLIENLAEVNADIRQGVDPRLLERERDLQNRLNASAKEQASARDENQAQQIARDIEEITSEVEQVKAQIRQTSPRYAALTQPQPLTLGDIQTGILDKDTVLLEYSLGYDRSFLWMITEDSVKSFELPTRAEIEKNARSVYSLLTTPQAIKTDRNGKKRGTQIINAGSRSPEVALKRLSQILLAPVAKDFTDKRLLIVSDGVLQFIPFGALPFPAGEKENKTNQKYEPLILKNEIVSLPSASTLVVLRRENGSKQPAPNTLAIFADPVFDSNDSRIKSDKIAAKNTQNKADRSSGKTNLPLLMTKSANESGVRNVGSGIKLPRLPGTRKEAEEILSLMPGGRQFAALDFAANRETVLNSNLSQYRFIHFATHGFLNSQHPELSGIALSMFDQNGNPQDGFFRLNEVFNLKLNADLVVLSACQTGLGKEVKGEGLVGLTRGFMYAGSPRVAVSLWSVSDDGTAELMSRFYRNMLVEKMRPAKALQEAQISLFKGKKYSSPYYWAAFTLQGEWR